VVQATAEELQALLAIQEHDTAIDRLARRRADLPARAPLEEARQRLRELDVRRAARTADAEQVQAREQRLDHEASAAATHADEVERNLYSGTISSPRELQALQADLDQLRRQQRALEDRELEVMEEREAIERDLTDLDSERSEIVAKAAELEREVATGEQDVDRDVADERSKREALVATVNEGLVADYERRRANAKNRGIAIARLVGNRCQGCGLTLPSVEVDRFRHAPEGTVCCPEDCTCILVPS
jgi:predicted  nucleic acid-binding Zn-ribbon protein